MSPASISTRSWMSTIATTRARSTGSSACSASTSANSPRCHECSAVFSRRAPPMIAVCRSTCFSRSASSRKASWRASRPARLRRPVLGPTGSRRLGHWRARDSAPGAGPFAHWSVSPGRWGNSLAHRSSTPGHSGQFAPLRSLIGRSARPRPTRPPPGRCRPSRGCGRSGARLRSPSSACGGGWTSAITLPTSSAPAERQQQPGQKVVTQEQGHHLHLSRSCCAARGRHHRRSAHRRPS